MNTNLADRVRDFRVRVQDEARSMSPIDLEFQGVRFRIHGDVPEVERELRFRFEPYYSFDPAVDAPPRFEIYASQTQAPADLLATLSSNQASSLPIQLHRTVQKYRRMGRALECGEQLAVLQDPTQTLTVSDLRSKCCAVSNRDVKLLAKDVRRLVRDLLGATLLATESVELHASGVAIDGEAIAFCGEANRGKTTALLQILRSRTGRIMCNGRLFLRRESPRPVAVGVPEHILVRPGTLASHPEFLHRFPTSLQESLDRGECPWELDQTQKISVRLADLLQTYECGITSEAPLGAIVLVDFNREEKGPLVHEVPRSLTRERLEPMILEPDACRRRFWHGLVSPNWPQYESRRRELIERIATETPHFQLRRGSSERDFQSELWRALESHGIGEGIGRS